MPEPLGVLRGPEPAEPQQAAAFHAPPIPNNDSTLAAIIYWARYKSFWPQALSRVLAINGLVGGVLWGIDELLGVHSRTLLLIRSDLVLTLFAAALIALAFTVVRMAIQLDPARPFTNPAALLLVLGVVVAVTSATGPVFVAVGEAAVMLGIIAVIQLRRPRVNSFLLLKIALVASAAILVSGLANGIATGELLQTRVSTTEAAGLVRLFVFLLGLSVYFLEERRYWLAQPPTPVVVERLQKACKQNDFSAISRWLGGGITFSQADQRFMADLILPRRLIVDGDIAIVPTPDGLLYARVRKGQVEELRVYKIRNSNSANSPSSF